MRLLIYTMIEIVLLYIYIYINIYIYKARLVARGFKEIEKDSIREDSPT